MTRRLLDRVVRRLELPADGDARPQKLLDTEWLVTNGLGGYASSTMAGVITRRYHGMLVAALPNPLGRMVMLNHLGESFDRRRRHDGAERRGARRRQDRCGGSAWLSPTSGSRPACRVWEYLWDGVQAREARLMPHRQNTVHVTYRLLEGPATAKLTLQPAVHFRGYEDPVNTTRHLPSEKDYRDDRGGGVHELALASCATCRRCAFGSPAPTDRQFVADERLSDELLYPVEESRGYEFRGTLWTPGHFEVELERDECVDAHRVRRDRGRHARAASPTRRRVRASSGAAVSSHRPRRRRRTTIGAELVLAADQFIITPAGRIADATRAAATGQRGPHGHRRLPLVHRLGPRHDDQSRGADARRPAAQREAAFILRTFAHYVRDGLIPNMFPDGSNAGPVSHRRRDALVLPRGRSVCAAHRRRGDAHALCCRR